MREDAKPPFPQVVFSGGGTRCFWQGGFMCVAAPRLVPDVERVAGVSGGALSAACFIADREHTLLEIMADAFARQDDNVTWDVVDPDTGLSPHQRIYRRVVEETLDDTACRRIAEGPPFEVLIAHPPRDRRDKVTGTLAALAYEAELHLVSSPHMRWAEKLGVDYSRVDARAAAREGRLIDLVCAAATIPPVFDMSLWEGRPVIDGGIADQAPLPEPDRGPTLILLTREYRRLPDVPDRLYVMPGRETPADKIDFTDPDKIRRTWDQGERDARAFLETHTPETN